MKGDIEFEFKVKTCLDQNDIGCLKRAKTMDERFQVLNDIFGEDPNIWEAFYCAALEAFDAKHPDAKLVE